MTDRRTIRISTRKQPKQARSAGLVTAILDAAVQVLAREGAGRFTTARVAERAGVSVGSLYQYFPNKAAILFRLQCDEWRRTTALLRGVLEDGTKPPPDRLRALVHAFILSECEEAAIRGALADAAPLYRDAPEVREAKSSDDDIFHAFLAEALPGVAEETRRSAGAMIGTTLGALGERFSQQSRSPAEIEAFSTTMADMFCAYLASLPAGSPAPRAGRRDGVPRVTPPTGPACR
ncbi:MAG: TetR/AcrR family transcriptional regulator [Telmatospirillum sp.]|nr:TetR/AcrR family transcriptional regulator [Telmatospirillum sp.]